MNYGILPLVFVDEADYDLIKQGDLINLEGARTLLKEGALSMTLLDGSTDRTIDTAVELSCRQRNILIEGGLLSHVGKASVTGAEA